MRRDVYAYLLTVVITADHLLLIGLAGPQSNAAKESLKLGFPEYEPNIELTFDPPWSHEMISEVGQDFLNEM